MGEPVTIDSDDIEALIYATAAIKGIENALEANRTDPFGQLAKGRFHAAHDRICNAWREALRKPQFPDRFAAATATEVDQLYRLWNEGAGKMMGAEVIIRSPRWSECRSLQLNGFVELGVRREMVAWAMSGDVSNLDDPKCNRVRLTPRGRDALVESGKVSRDAFN